MHSNKLLRNFIALSFAVCTIAIARGQEDDKKEKHFSLKIGQSTDNDATKSLPAKFTGTYPRGSQEASFNTQGFIELGWAEPNKSNKKWEFSTVLELHRNTLIDKEQDVFQFGFQHFRKFGYEQGESGYRPKLTTNVRYSRDRVNDKRGLQYLGHFSLYMRKNSVTNFWDVFLQNERTWPVNERESDEINGFQLSDLFQAKSSHSAGFEHIAYENLTLLHFAYNLEVYPLSGLLYQLFGQYQRTRELRECDPAIAWR